MLGIGLGDLSEGSAHYFGRERVGQSVRELDVFGSGNCADMGSDPLAQFLGKRVCGRYTDLERNVSVNALALRYTDLERNVSVNALALDVVRDPDHRGFRDLGVSNQCALNLRGSDAM